VKLEPLRCHIGMFLRNDGNYLSSDIMTQRYIPGDRNPGLHRCDNLGSYIYFIFLSPGVKSAICAAYFMYEAFCRVFVLITVILRDFRLPPRSG